MTLECFENKIMHASKDNIFNQQYLKVKKKQEYIHLKCSQKKNIMKW